MARYHVITFRSNKLERDLIKALAMVLCRSQSDICRMGIRALADIELGESIPANETHEKSPDEREN